MTDPDILCWRIQISIDRTLHIRIPNEKDSLVLKSFQKWQKLTFFVGTFKFRLTEPHIFCRDIQIQQKKTVQYLNDFKDDKPQHPL